MSRRPLTLAALFGLAVVSAAVAAGPLRYAAASAELDRAVAAPTGG